MAAIGVIVALSAITPVRTGLVTVTWRWVASSVGLLGLRATPGEGGLLTFTHGGAAFSYRIVEECTAITVVGLFAVAVLATPSIPWAKRVAGLVAGTVALLALNWLRLLSLAWVGVHHHELFDLAHVWLWQGVAVAAVIGMWLAWLAWASGRPSGPHWRQAGWFVATAGVMGLLLQATALGSLYSRGVDSVLHLVQRATALLPYRTIQFAEPDSEWGMLVRTVSLALAVALTVTLAGDSPRERLRAGLTAVPLVFAAHWAGALLEDASDARLADASASALTGFVQIPLLVLAHGFTLAVPLLLWARHRREAAEREPAPPFNAVEN
ncbi:MAG TPA: hypothetical protein VNU01_02475 [Egibacteraceae bacterium]|nr:hypothetical protein [Egibacteraceae bacterium]